MSHFYSSIQGQKGSVTRCGSKSSGIKTHIYIWDFGIEVRLEHKNGKDIAYIFQTGGSNNKYSKHLLTCLTKDGWL